MDRYTSYKPESRIRRELDFGHRLPLFAWYDYSSFDERWSSWLTRIESNKNVFFFFLGTFMMGWRWSSSRCWPFSYSFTVTLWVRCMYMIWCSPVVRCIHKVFNHFEVPMVFNHCYLCHPATCGMMSFKHRSLLYYSKHPQKEDDKGKREKKKGQRIILIM